MYSIACRDVGMPRLPNRMGKVQKLKLKVQI